MDAGVGLEPGKAQAGDAGGLKRIVEAGGIKRAEEAFGEHRLAGLLGKLGRRGWVGRYFAMRHWSADGADVKDEFSSGARTGEFGGDCGGQRLARRLEAGAGEIFLLQVDQQEGGAAHSG